MYITSLLALNGFDKLKGLIEGVMRDCGSLCVSGGFMRKFMGICVIVRIYACSESGYAFFIKKTACFGGYWVQYW